jgi:hypothetical protein
MELSQEVKHIWPAHENLGKILARAGYGGIGTFAEITWNSAVAGVASKFWNSSNFKKWRFFSEDHMSHKYDAVH